MRRAAALTAAAWATACWRAFSPASAWRARLRRAVSKAIRLLVGAVTHGVSSAAEQSDTRTGRRRRTGRGSATKKVWFPRDTGKRRGAQRGPHHPGAAERGGRGGIRVLV